MKKITLLFSMLIFSFSVYSQDILTESDVSNSEYDQQIGINSTALISQLINFSSNFSVFNSNYIFTYKKRKGNKNFRLGVGGGFFFEKEDSDKRSNVSIRLRLGRERFTDISKRWRVYYGGDFKIDFDNTSAFFLDEPIRRYSLGGGPVCGLQFNINSRLSLATEASYDLMAFAQTNDGDNSWGINTGFSVPNFFNLNFDF